MHTIPQKQQAMAEACLLEIISKNFKKTPEIYPLTIVFK